MLLLYKIQPRCKILLLCYKILTLNARCVVSIARALIPLRMAQRLRRWCTIVDGLIQCPAALVHAMSMN